MKCTITIEMDNEAFTEFPEMELGRILVHLGNCSLYYNALSPYPILDLNGNKVGSLTISE